MGVEFRGSFESQGEGAYRALLVEDRADRFLARIGKPCLLTLKDIADALGVEREQVRQAWRDGVLPLKSLGTSKSAPSLARSMDLTPEVLRMVKHPQARPGALPDCELVYFIGSEGKFVKIGYSTNLAKRYENLQASTPYRLKLLAYVEGGTRKVETQYHRRFAEHRVVGEWFKLVPEIKAEIDKVRCK